MRVFYLLLTLLFLIISPAAARPAAPPDSCWQPGFGVPAGPNGPVYALVWANGSLYVGGYFSAAGEVAARNVARWDGTRWHSLGTGDENGLSSSQRSFDSNPVRLAAVYALAVAPNGDVYAGGEFDQAGRMPAPGLARWDGRHWNAVGDFLHLEEQLYGEQDEKAERRWRQRHRHYSEAYLRGEGRYRSASFSRRSVRALALAADGMLYAAGTFQYAASAYPTDTAASSVVRWDGHAWTVPGQGVPGQVLALAATPDGRVYAGGDFGDSPLDQPGVQIKVRGRVACWDGRAWATIGRGHHSVDDDTRQGVDGVVHALAVGPDGAVYAAGASVMMGYGTIPPADDVARWDGHAWQLLGAGPDCSGYGTVQALAVADGRVYATGTFQLASRKSHGPGHGSRVAVWDGHTWLPLDPDTPLPPPNVRDDVAALAVSPAGQVYIGGNLWGSGQQLVGHGLARWGAGRWDYLPAPGAQGLDGDVQALAVAAGGRMYAGGLFRQAGSTPTRSLACWDGHAWQALPLGCLADSQGTPTIMALAVAANGQLYAGAGPYGQGPRASRVARWDGHAWQPLGTGLQGDGPADLPGVWALAADHRGGVYVAGMFGGAGGLRTRNIAHWTGTGWEALGPGLNGFFLTALAVAPNGDLYAGGEISLRAGHSQQQVVRWDGHAWHPLGGFDNVSGNCRGMNAGIHALAVAPSGELYAGGLFTTANGVPARNVARWDGTAWHALAPADTLAVAHTCGGVHSLAFTPGGVLYAGGSFELLGGVLARGVARWDGTRWHPLGPGFAGTVLAVAYAPGGRVVAGGGFTATGNLTRAAAHFAVLDPAACPPVITRPARPRR